MCTSCAVIYARQTDTIGRGVLGKLHRDVDTGVIDHDGTDEPAI